MKLLFLLVVGLVFFGLILSVLASHAKRVGEKLPWPFYAKRLMSAPEQVLYHRLVRALPDHIVLAQVQLSRILGVKKGNRFHEWNNRINRMSADFVICGKDTSVIAVIELGLGSGLGSGLAITHLLNLYLS